MKNVCFTTASILCLLLCAPAHAVKQGYFDEAGRDTSAVTEHKRPRATGAYDLSGVKPYPFDSLTPRQQKTYLRQQHRDSVRAGKNVWISPFGGPSYTPEASVGIGGAILASFRVNKSDSLSSRSFLPRGFNISTAFLLREFPVCAAH